MPRDGSSIYTFPAGTHGIPGTPIESAKYNAYVDDVTVDLNTPRPVVAGGTGATSSDGALVNVSGEKAAQNVTNWDSMLWMPGSFYAAVSAIGISPIGTVPPTTGHAFSGICYLNEPLANPPTNKNLVLEARDLTDPANPPYFRVMTAGVWGAWLPGRQAIYAAPVDALAYNGMQINGSMDVSQELGLTGRTTPGYICDGWRFNKIGSSAINAQQAAAASIPLFSNLIVLSVATAQPSLAAGDGVWVFSQIEGYRTTRLGWGTASAQPITIGFWTAHARTGIYSVAVHNGTDDRAYVTTYTQNVANAAEYKTVTIPGDTAGNWIKDNGVGLAVLFALAAGSNWMTATPNTWLANSAMAASTQINSVAATSDVFRITGVVVLPGIEVPSAARSPLIMRPYDQEIVMCRRYWNTSIGALDTNQTAGGIMTCPINYGIVMRAIPTITFSGLLAANNGAVVVTGSTSTTSGVSIQSTTFGGRGYWYGYVYSDARL